MVDDENIGIDPQALELGKLDLPKFLKPGTDTAQKNSRPTKSVRFHLAASTHEDTTVTSQAHSNITRGSGSWT